MFTATATALHLGPTVIARGTAAEMRLLAAWLTRPPHRVLPFTRRLAAPAAARCDTINQRPLKELRNG